MYVVSFKLRLIYPRGKSLGSEKTGGSVHQTAGLERVAKNIIPAQFKNLTKSLKAVFGPRYKSMILGPRSRSGKSYMAIFGPYCKAFFFTNTGN
jgi:hypothetical protein